MKPFETRHDQRVKLCLVPLNLSEFFYLEVENFVVLMLLSVMVQLNSAISQYIMTKKKSIKY